MSTSARRVEGTRAASPSALQNLPYRQVPEVPQSRAVSLPSTAFRLLGELRYLAGKGDSLEVTDHQLGAALNRSEITAQRLLHLLEQQGLISRRRRRGHRTITLLFSLRRGPATGVHALVTRGQVSEEPGVHALVKNDECTDQERRVQSSKMTGSPHPSYFESEKEQQQAEAVVVAPPPDSLVGELTSRGVTTATAEQLAATIPPGRIRAKLEVFDWMVRKKDRRLDRSPAGYLVQSIRADYQPPAGFVSAASQAQAQQLAHAEAEIHNQAEQTRQDVEAKAHARTQSLRAAWERLSEPERQNIRDDVHQEFPQFRRWPKLLEPLYLDRLEARTAAAPTKTPARVSAKTPRRAREGRSVPDPGNSTGLPPQ
jgi:hypothetical protein